MRKPQGYALEGTRTYSYASINWFRFEGCDLRTFARELMR